MTLTKRDLVIRISDETNLGQHQVFEVVQKTLNYITESLAKGDKVELRKFGVFEVKVRKARVGRNPNKPENRCSHPCPLDGKVQGRQGNARSSLETPGQNLTSAPLRSATSAVEFLICCFPNRK